MKNNINSLILFTCCVISLIISLRQSIYISSNYANMFFVSAKTVYSGEFWVTWDWTRLLLLGIATFISLVNLIKGIFER